MTFQIYGVNYRIITKLYKLQACSPTELKPQNDYYYCDSVNAPAWRFFANNFRLYVIEIPKTYYKKSETGPPPRLDKHQSKFVLLKLKSNKSKHPILCIPSR